MRAPKGGLECYLQQVSGETGSAPVRLLRTMALPETYDREIRPGFRIWEFCTTIILQACKMRNSYAAVSHRGHP